MSSRFYITTPIYYPNGEPHLGHVYTTLIADTVARFHRLRGDDTFFLTGTDEHGTKMVKSASEAGITPRQLADQMSGVFRSLWQELHVTNDDFIRTPENRHRQTVQFVVSRLLANGDIYLGSYAGWYDEGQEEFVTETTAKEQQYKSAVSGRPLARYEEPSYFLRLTKYVPRILEYITAHPDFIQPASRRNEVVSKLKAGVDDLSISRATLDWGIPMPNDARHVVYVWIDALSNYITALGYGSADDAKFQEFWPANIHLIGKEIMWFHTVYWPAMLMSLGLPLPRTVFAHGWWTSDGKKMSKSMGNFIGLEKLRGIVAAYGEDALRYYLLRAAPFGSDLNWSDHEFTTTYDELLKVLGNCLNRVVSMIGRYRDGVVPAMTRFEPIDQSLQDATHALHAKLESAYASLELQQTAMLPIELARAANGYIDATAPFKLAKDPAQAGRLDTVLNLSAQAITRAFAGLLPILPEKAVAGLAQLNHATEGKTFEQLMATALPPGHKLAPPRPLFPKIETAT